MLVDPTGAAHLADLERATDVEAETSPLFDPARLGTALTYVSPEQTGRVNRAVDARSDLYCLGLVLFELVAGSPPFTDPSPRALAHAHIARRPPRLDERRPGCPVLLADLVDRLLRKHPEDRYATAAAVADDLRAIADDIAAGRTPSFALGHHDVEPRLRLSDVLFGRDAELRRAPRGVGRRGSRWPRARVRLRLLGHRQVEARQRAPPAGRRGRRLVRHREVRSLPARPPVRRVHPGRGRARPAGAHAPGRPSSTRCRHGSPRSCARRPPRSPS